MLWVGFYTAASIMAAGKMLSSKQHFLATWKNHCPSREQVRVPPNRKLENHRLKNAKRTGGDM